MCTCQGHLLILNCVCIAVHFYAQATYHLQRALLILNLNVLRALCLLLGFLSGCCVSCLLCTSVLYVVFVACSNIVQAIGSWSARRSPSFSPPKLCQRGRSAAPQIRRGAFNHHRPSRGKAFNGHRPARRRAFNGHHPTRGKLITSSPHPTRGKARSIITTGLVFVLPLIRYAGTSACHCHPSK